MRQKERLYRVVTFLKREELDFLDDLVKDIYFTYGIKIPRAKVMEEIIAEFKEKGAESKRELVNKILFIARPQADRRKYPRLKKNLLIGYKKLDSLEQYKNCLADNIGMGGLKIEVPHLDEALAANQVIELALKSPEEQQTLEPIKAIGRVAWVKEKENKQSLEIGVMLTYIRKEDRERFARYMGKAKEAKEQNK